MNIKGKILFFAPFLFILMSIITTSPITSTQIRNELKAEELYLSLWYDNEPHLNEDTPIECHVDSNENTVTFSLELYIENSTHTLLLYSNSSIYLYSSNPYFDYYHYLVFNKTECWDIWLNVTTTTGNNYCRHGWLEASPFELYIWQDDYYAYFNEPTEYYLEVDYYDYSARNIVVEVILNNYISNTSIYYNNSVPQFSGFQAWQDSFNHNFTATGSYRLWLIVYDGPKKWTSSELCTYVQWVEIKISTPDDVFIENSTTINFEIYSSVPLIITLDIYVYIAGGYYYNPFNQTFYMNTTTLDGTMQKVSYTDSITIEPYIFPSWGGHCHDIVVKAIDSTNNEETESSYHLHVHEEIEINLDNDRNVWLGDYNGYEETITLWLDINYMGTKSINVTIELLLDDGNSNTTLYYNDSHSYDGVTPYSFDHDWMNEFYVNIDHTFNEKGFYDIWVLVRIKETGKIFNYVHSWLQVYKEDTQAPKLLDISGLEDDATYTGIITVTIWLEDETGIENVRLQISNENYSSSVYFGEVIVVDEYYETKLQLDTSKIYDGYYITTIIAKDVLGNAGSVLQMNIYFKNGNIYTHTSTTDKNEEDMITSGFEYLALVTAISFCFLLRKIRKAD